LVHPRPQRAGTRNVLLVEDNPGDVRLMQEAMREAQIPIEMNVVPDERSPRPDLIFLDLNLPKRDGREVLAELKKSDQLRRIPVIVLTTSEAERDIANAYDLYANCYVKKPLDLEKFIEVIRHCERFWLEIVRLPTR
jgi:chemotaxis family two-component system response regulator Rcp1